MGLGLVHRWGCLQTFFVDAAAACYPVGQRLWQQSGLRDSGRSGREGFSQEICSKRELSTADVVPWPWKFLDV